MGQAPSVLAANYTYHKNKENHNNNESFAKLRVDGKHTKIKRIATPHIKQSVTAAIDIDFARETNSNTDDIEANKFDVDDDGFHVSMDYDICPHEYNAKLLQLLMENKLQIKVTENEGEDEEDEEYEYLIPSQHEYSQTANCHQALQVLGGEDVSYKTLSEMMYVYVYDQQHVMV